MTPKEKAKELVNKFRLSPILTDSYVKAIAKTAVDEILKLDNPNTYNYLTEGKENLIVELADNYWQNVKKEIENL